jgi:tetratricopeptide (TPR) repeat protein
MIKTIVIFVLVAALAFPVFGQQQSQSSQQQQPTLPVIGGDLFTKGGDALQNQDYQGAVLDFSLFILLNPTFSPAYFGRAQGYLNLNQYDSALHDANQAITSASSTSSAQYGANLYGLRGDIFQAQQRFDDALKDYTQSITLSPSVQSLANRALIYAAQNNYPAALDDFTSAINLNSGSPALHVYRGYINTKLNNLQAAAADYLDFFTLIQTNQPDSNELAPGQLVSFQMDRGIVHRFHFKAKAGQLLSAIATPRSGDVDPLMVLTDASGHALIGDDDSGGNNGALITDYPIPADGDYLLVVSHSLGGFTGQMAVGIQLTDKPSS